MRTTTLPRRKRALAALVLAAWTTCASADVFVVVPSTSSVRALTQKQVLDIYMGRSRAFPGGDFAVPFDMPRDSAERAAFYLALTGMGPAQVNSYWSRLMFSGQIQPPQPLAGETAMLDTVKRGAAAIGYLPQEPADKAVRVVLVLKDAR